MNKVTVIGAGFAGVEAAIEELCKCGYIYADETIRDVFNSIN